METSGTPQSPQMGPEEAAVVAKLRRKRQSKGTACQACANQKMKCVPQESGKCERCQRNGRECVPAMRAAEKRQMLDATHLDGIQPDGVSNIDSNGAHHSTTNASPRYDSPISSRHSLHRLDTNALLLRHDLTYTGSKSFITLFWRGIGNAPVCEPLLQGVDYNFVTNCFTIFRQQTPYFPFVELSPAADVVPMVARRPALTLAVCTVASASSPILQDRLSQAFLQCISSKAILGGECSLDLFTGLLVYLAWQHHYLVKQQTYQKLCLLTGMASDLGLYRPNLSSMDDPGSALERDRAFVGCYCLCSALCATGYDKPNPLRWTDNLRLAAKSASIVGTLPSDRDLISSLELMRAVDDFSESAQDHHETSNGSTHYMELHTRATFHRLKALKREHPSLASSLGYAAANLHVYQRVLRSSLVSDPAMLIQSACAVKEYTDDILARPASTLHQMSVVGWVGLLEILLLMAKVSKPSTGGWEAGALTSMLQPEVMLDSLCSHMASTPSDDPLSLRHEGLVKRFRGVCESIKRHYLHDSDSSVTPSTHQASFLDPLSCFGNGVLDPSFWNSLSGQ